MKDYCKYDAIGLAELVQTGHVSSEELLQEAFSRFYAWNPRINAIVYCDESKEKLTKIPPGRIFSGVPFLLKDIHASIRGMPMSHGSRLLNSYLPPDNSEITNRYLSSGLVIFGKTNNSEFGLLPVTEPDLFGPARNPWNPEHTPGGSSGGAAAAVAAGIVPMAHGSDGGGSIRIPASCCGLFGFKPSRGLAPTGPHATELFFGYGTQHVISRSVRDSAAALQVISGPDSDAFSRRLIPSAFAQTGPQRSLRIALSAVPLGDLDVHPNCIRVLEAAGKLCQNLGHSVEIYTPKIDRESFAQDYSVMCCAGALMAISAWEKHFGRSIGLPEVEPETELCRRLAESFSAKDVLKARDRLSDVQRQMELFYSTFDVLLTPTFAIPPLRVGQFRPAGLLRTVLEAALTWPIRMVIGVGWVRNVIIRKLIEFGQHFAGFAPLANIAGLPSMSVPLGLEEGLPIGMMFTAGNNRDYTLFRLASELEVAAPWDTSPKFRL